MDFQDLTIFVRAAAVQNLTSVGAELGLAPGTISKRIQALETELDVKLFDRTTRSIRITDEGRKFLVHAERALHEIELARASLDAATSAPVGRLRIAMPELLGHRLGSSIVHSFIAAYPQVSMHLDLTDRSVNLHEDGYDLIVSVGGLAESSLIAKKLSSDRLIYVAAPKYIERYGMPRLPEDLTHHTCLVLSDCYTWSFRNGDGEDGVLKLNVALRSNSNATLRRAALDGIGILRTTALQVADDIDEGSLVPVLTEVDQAAELGVYALYLAGRNALPRIRAFIDHLVESFRTAQSAAGDVPPRRLKHRSKFSVVGE